MTILEKRLTPLCPTSSSEPPNDGNFACPGLNKLRLAGKVDSHSPIFVQMVEQRWSVKAVANQVEPLESVNVEFREHSPDRTEDLLMMKLLKSEGLLARVSVKGARIV